MDYKYTGNPNIRCSVNSCAYHADINGGLCTLQGISVGHTKEHVSQPDATECVSFELGDHGATCGTH